jgi:predicted 2-oxoglutarate/Fe(II)-dependent dioxygenase YbiX
MVHVPGFATTSECTYIIQSYERCRTYCHMIGDGFFDNRVLWINSFPDSENDSRRILQRWRYQAVDVISRHIGSRVYSDTIQVVRWDGQEMPAHQDDRHPDGAPHNTPWRAWASVIYLNADFDGGDIYFPDTGECYKPITGSLIFFEGCLWHGVRAASRGVRYTSPSWYSTDPSHEDPYAVVQY